MIYNVYRINKEYKIENVNRNLSSQKKEVIGQKNLISKGKQFIFNQID